MAVAERYDEIAENHGEVDRVVSTYRSLVETPSFLKALGPVEGTSVLDFGCGTGAYTRLLRRRGAHPVVGVDISPGMVEAARRIEEGQPLGLRYEVHDMADMPVLGAFDTVVAVAVLHYARDRRMLDRMVLRARDNLVPGGRLLAYVGNPRLPSGTAQMNGFLIDMPEHPVDGDPCPVTIPTASPTVLPARYWSCEAMEDSLRGAGFDQVRWEPVAGIPPGAGEPLNLLLSARVPA
ncbi:class I SAM-dependent methyltransferase [Nocardiopsis dassonvillei]|uniref:class I SAM-dependent methyltransferase n=1 Tax=Nocardiopsis dassonvillei TaxID=2014 RepID=UPI0033FDD316